MGIYSAKFTEAAIDSIQTPEDIGVDLDQVENDIAGKDGIEAHRDEVEAAEEGMIGDPVEEAAYILYESEYNYNQIMEAIGVAELREATYGRDIVYEAADIKSFLDKVKKMLVSMFESITKAVKTILAKMDIAARADRAFVSKYEKEIKAGFATDWKKPGYDFSKATDLVIKSSLSDTTYHAECEKTLTTVKNTGEAGDYFSKISGGDYKSRVIEAVSGIKDVSSITDMTEALVKKYFVKVENVKSTTSAEKVIEILKNERETRAIRDTYKAVKKGYNDSLRFITKLQQKVNSVDYGAGFNVAMNVCEAGARVTKFEKNAVNNVYGVYMKVARAKRAQARSIAHYCVAAAKKSNKTEVQHNSAELGGNTVFGNINFI